MSLYLVSYFERQIEEIRKSRVLQIYGLLLAFLQVLSAIYWLQMRSAEFLARGAEAICWPMWENCESWRFLDVPGTQMAIMAFLAFGVVVMRLFLSTRTAQAAYWSLLALNVVKLVILAMDFRLRMNHHIMAFWVTFVFLFLPQKNKSLQFIIPFFYFWAGTLKINSEWLSGSALYGELWLFHGAAVKWACTYVVILELALIWGLWLDGTWIAWATWLQLMIFHTFSFPIVGFFYPVLMYAILMIYPLSWGWPPGAWKRRPLLTAIFKGEVAKSVYIAIAVFSAFQILPKLMPGDTAVTGEGRAFALHMFDSWTTCQAIALIKTSDGPPRETNLRIPLPIRLHCDPIVYLSRARRLCRTSRESNSHFIDLDLGLKTRRSNDGEMISVVDIKDFCSKETSYSLFWKNDWIHGD